jgi:hypothetical protein
MLNGGETFSMGRKPGSGFSRSRWEHYCELMMIYLLAIGRLGILFRAKRGRHGHVLL